MPVIEITTDIQAPSKACFDLARDIGFHLRSLQHTNEQAIAGRTDGLIELGESVTWRARHLGMTRTMTVEITVMDRPNHFRDVQTQGPFKHFRHDHTFLSLDEYHTRMIDRIDFASPYGLLGQLIDRAMLKPYMTRLITRRSEAMQTSLETTS